MSERDTKQGRGNMWKCHLGLEITKVALAPYVGREFKEYMNTWQKEELNDLSHFFNDTKNVRRGLKTECEGCDRIFKRIEDLRNTTKRGIHVYKNEASNVFDNKEMKTADQFMEMCFICESTNCIFQAHRSGISLKDTRIASLQSLNPSQRDDIETYYWELAKMFMDIRPKHDFLRKLRSVGLQKRNDCPEVTDVEKIFRIMKNCKLFRISDDNLYDQILEAIRTLNDTIDERLSDDECQQLFDIFDALMKEFEDKTEYCKRGREELSKLKLLELYLPTMNENNAALIHSAWGIQRSMRATSYMDSFSEDIEDSDRQQTTNWIKGSLALEVTKVSISRIAKTKWVTELLNWGQDVLHIQHFFEQRDEQKGHMEIFYSKNKKEKKQGSWQIRTSCNDCKLIFQHILKLHRNNTSMDIVWQPDKQSQGSFNVSAQSIKKSTHRVHRCTVCRTTECIFEAHRKGETIDIGITPILYVEEYYWRIANMFMFRKHERNEFPNTSPLDTDPALLFKMMKNCTLFQMDSDAVYDNVLSARNHFMHSGNQRVPRQDLEKCIGFFIDLLSEFEDEYCIRGETELCKLMTDQLRLTSVNSDDFALMSHAFKVQQEALTCDIHVTGTIGQSVYTLKGILEINKQKLETSDLQYDAVKAYENEIRDLKRRTEELERETARLKTECDTERLRREEAEKHSNESQSSTKKVSLGGAALGATIGSIGGPPGMVAGGLIGSYFDNVFSY